MGPVEIIDYLRAASSSMVPWREEGHRRVERTAGNEYPRRSPKVQFEYATLGKQTLTLRIITSDGINWEVFIQSETEAPVLFEQIIDLPPSMLAEISIETDGKASPLGDRDVRMAAWIVRNMTINPVSH
jgi:hypothetical protein